MGLGALAVGPNPAQATVAVTLPKAGDVRVVRMDLLGREVAVAYDGPMEAGVQRVPLATGSLAAGVYVVVLDAGGERMTRQLTVVR